MAKNWHDSAQIDDGPVDFILAALKPPPFAHRPSASSVAMTDNLVGLVAFDPFVLGGLAKAQL
ncbi:hypothetical protein G3M48_002010 [Beauveria asiatica]|uniref:Uncharacterized protein n=1 Tax=Beauveria asiatica TaxID=1069075 RepID=A0AAW0RY78_9HYPO